MAGLAVVIPTIREDRLAIFLKEWAPLFEKHNVDIVIVHDGNLPYVEYNEQTISLKEVMEDHADLIFNHNDGVRNLGFAYVARYLKETNILITLDDDVSPIGDTIQDHVDALSMKVPVSWLMTSSEYMRGFPYGIREEAEVVLSHGIWTGTLDYDAPTQLVLGNRVAGFYKGSIPKNIYYPMSGMNIAFKRKILSAMYFAPMGPKVGIDRFADIWTGITSKRYIDSNGFAVVSGYAMVDHSRASNIFTNIVKESKGLALNENFWKGEDKTNEYFLIYEEKIKRWAEFLKKYNREI